jgi:hypothetical protein
MARRSEAEIVADLKKRIREKQERAARKANPEIVRLDELLEGLERVITGGGVGVEDRRQLVDASAIIRNTRNGELTAWIEQHG